MKILFTITTLILAFFLSTPAFAQDMDYRLDGCIPTLNGPSAQIEPINPPAPSQTPSKSELKEIWEEMESLTLNMIDLEVEVLDLKAQQLKIIPFVNISSKEEDTPHQDEIEDEAFGEDHATDQIRYEMLQMARHLSGLTFQVACIRNEVAQMNPYQEETNTPNTRNTKAQQLQIERNYGKPVMQAGDSTECYWKEMENMAIQAMDLEVEISDLRAVLSTLKRNAWELDQIALSKGNPNR